MSVSLEIPDGNPWWLSPDLWTVPGNNPEGYMGMPIVGESCYVWTRVTNNGSTNVRNASVRFYWANPSVGFNRVTANAIGTSYVSLNPGETADVLCLTPWVPEFINEGHVCILAEAFHSSYDPLPATVDFNVPSDRHVAQRNINVVHTSTNALFKLSFEVHNPERTKNKFHLKTRIDKLNRIEPLLKHFGPHFERPEKEGKLRKLGFVNVPCPKEDALKSAFTEIKDLELNPGQRIGLSLIGSVANGALLIHVEQFSEKAIVGGLSILVIANNSHVKAQKGGRK